MRYKRFYKSRKGEVGAEALVTLCLKVLLMVARAKAVAIYPGALGSPSKQQKAPELMVWVRRLAHTHSPCLTIMVRCSVALSGLVTSHIALPPAG